MSTTDTTDLECVTTNGRRLLDAIGVDLETLPERDRHALMIVSFTDPATVAAVCRLIDRAHDAAARACPHPGGGL